MSRQLDNKSIAPCSCAWVQARLWDYLDGTLETKDRARWQSHADACPPCQAELATARRSERALNQVLSSIPPAGDLRSGFYAKLAASGAAKRPARNWGWTLAVPALAAGLLAVVFLRPTTSPTANSPVNETPPTVAGIAPVKPLADLSDDLLAAKERTPLMAKVTVEPAVSAPVKSERLALATAELPKHLSKQDIRRALKTTVAMAEGENLGRHWGFGANLAEDAPAHYFFAKADKLSSLRLSHPDTRLKQKSTDLFAEAESAQGKDALTERGELKEEQIYGEAGQWSEGNVQRVALADQTEADSESYLEVEDETRNFRLSTRLASFQDSDDGIEISVSSDDDEPEPVQESGAE